MLGVEWRSLPSAHSSVSACRHAGWAIWYCNLCECVDVGGTTENKLVYVCVSACVVVRMLTMCVYPCVVRMCLYVFVCVFFLCMCRCPCVYIYIHVYVPVCCVQECVYMNMYVCACLYVFWVKVEFLYSVLISWPANLPFFSLSLQSIDRLSCKLCIDIVSWVTATTLKCKQKYKRRR